MERKVERERDTWRRREGIFGIVKKLVWGWTNFTDTVAEAKQSLKAKPKPQRIYVTDSIFFFLLDFCFTDIVNYCKVTFGAWQRGNRVGIKYYLNFHILGILEYLLF